MLDRLQAARLRQRAFVADASHDLQSPLAAQRVQIEVALADPEDTDVTSLGQALLPTTEEMERLVRDLLFLAAADEGAAPPSLGPVDVEDVVLEEVARARLGTRLRIDTGAVSAAPAHANRDDVGRILRNLLDNAVAHAATTVSLRAGTDGGITWVEVADDGPGVPASERERIFERFHRADAARSRHGTGSGLGLAIARTLARRQGGHLELGGDAPGACFVLRLRGSGG
jgi:signal transduction histidine kinase